MSDFLSRLVREKPLGAFGGIIVLLLLFTGIFADVLAPFPMSEPHMLDRLTGPSGKYLLGTDQLGRDVLSRIIYGARVSLVVGLAATSVNMVVALLIGTTTGFFGGKLDMVVQRFVDAWMAFPGLLILITVMSLVGQGLLQTILVLGISGGIGGSRIARSAVIGIRENMYLQAAEAFGASAARTIFRHILPNIMAHDHHLHRDHWRRHHGRGFAELPRFRSSPGCRHVGRDAQQRRAPVHGVGAMAGYLAGPLPDGGGVQSEYAR